jgi:hypothetical protein
MDRWARVDAELETNHPSHGSGLLALLRPLHPFTDLDHGVELVVESVSS